MVGIGEVPKTCYPDPPTKPSASVLIDIKPAMPFTAPLVDLKQAPNLKDMALMKDSRLSVKPVTAERWKHVFTLGGVKG